MTRNRLNWGFLSTARINRALIEPIRSSSRSQLMAVASRTKEQAESYARANNIPKAYGTYEELLNDASIDVIYNSLPNSLHAEWTVKAAQAGKHVLCEKPLATSLEEVDSITEAAQKYGVIICEAFMYRHHPLTLKVKELVDRGAIGKLILIRGSFSFVLNRENDIRFDTWLGGGSIWDVGCYPISYARMLTGAEPSEVFGWQVLTKSGVDQSFIGQIRFPSDILTQIDSSFSIPFRTNIEVSGSDGSLYIQNPFKPGIDESFILRSGNDSRTIHLAGESLYKGEVEDIADAILIGKPPRISLADSKANVATILALLRSARESRPISL